MQELRVQLNANQARAREHAKGDVDAAYAKGLQEGLAQGPQETPRALRRPSAQLFSALNPPPGGARWSPTGTQSPREGTPRGAHVRGPPTARGARIAAARVRRAPSAWDVKILIVEIVTTETGSVRALRTGTAGHRRRLPTCRQSCHRGPLSLRARPQACKSLGSLILFLQETWWAATQVWRAACAPPFEPPT